MVELTNEQVQENQTSNTLQELENKIQLIEDSQNTLIEGVFENFILKLE